MKCSNCWFFSPDWIHITKLLFTNLLSSKLVFISYSWLLVFFFILFSQKAFTKKDALEGLGRQSVSSFTFFFYGTIKKNCNHDAFNKNSFLCSKLSNENIDKESSNYPSGIPQLALETFHRYHWETIKNHKMQKGREWMGKKVVCCCNRQREILAIIGEKYCKWNSIFLFVERVFCTISIVRLTFSLRTPSEDIWKAFLRLFR